MEYAIYSTQRDLFKNASRHVQHLPMHRLVEVTLPNDLITSRVCLASSKQDREWNSKDPYLIAS
jgi:hypothetical protein